ncbi:portal protein [Mycobacterium phage Avocado]|uniref:Portal protein n=1 Tax=Mycobacterium phage Avocado TaxID=2024302 RepID=A0A222Z0X6_9CAUD|nr:portal protein [Mycobacterium phage Avocado]ASR77205.1 portal protein [Mycobacterium phage Avocado]
MTTAVEAATEPKKFTFTIPDLNDDVVDTINRLYQQLVDRAPRNLLRAGLYDGKYAIGSIGSVIPPEYLRTATVLGWAAKAVDTLARRCNLDAFVWPDGNLADEGGTELWDDNWFATKANSGMVSSLIHGPAFLINTEGDTSEGEPKSLITVKSALHATGDWNPRRMGMDRLLSVLAYDDKGNPSSIALYEDGVTVTSRRDEQTGRWESDVQTHGLGVPVEVLPYHPREDRQMGSSRISRPVISLQKRALRGCIRMDGHADVYSFPQMILLGADASNFKNKDGSIKPAWQVALARVFALPDDKEEPDAARARADVKQFPAASPEPHIKFLEQIAMLFSGETSIPIESLGFSNRANPTSADAYIASREDLIAEAEGATDDWAPALRRSFQRGLAIQNGLDSIPDEYRSIDAKFRSPLYLSKAAQADAGSKTLASLPDWVKETEVGFQLAGLDEQQVKLLMAEKRRQGSVSLVDALNAGNPDQTVPPGDQPDVVPPAGAAPAGPPQLAAVNGNRGA